MRKIAIFLTWMFFMGSANATSIVNESFETGDISGWVSNNSAHTSVVVSASGLSATDGDYFALITSPDLWEPPVTLSQNLFGTSLGDTLIFDWATDFSVFDFASVILSLNGNEISSTTLSDPNQQAGDPLFWNTYQLPLGGIQGWDLTFEVLANPFGHKNLYIDNIRLVNASVPAPATLFLVLVGAGLLVFGKKNQEKEGLVA